MDNHRIYFVEDETTLVADTPTYEYFATEEETVEISVD